VCVSVVQGSVVEGKDPEDTQRETRVLAWFFVCVCRSLSVVEGKDPEDTQRETRVLAWFFVCVCRSLFVV